MSARYKPTVSGGEVDETTVICVDCSTRATVVAVRVEDVSKHDALHAPDGRVCADRDETDPCQAGTVGCCIDHNRDSRSCESW